MKMIALSSVKILLLLTYILSVTYASPVRCIKTAPYDIYNPVTILSIYDVVRQGMSLYLSNVAYFIENLNTLPPSRVEEATDNFMEIFCKGRYFKGFIGLTNTGELITNRTYVRQLYKEYALRPGIHVPFNVKSYNKIITIPEKAQENRFSVYANLTAFNEHIIGITDVDNNNSLLLVNGNYQIEWRINVYGNICISAFHDTPLIINEIHHTSLLEIPWNLQIIMYKETRTSLFEDSTESSN